MQVRAVFFYGMSTNIATHAWCHDALLCAHAASRHWVNTKMLCVLTTNGLMCTCAFSFGVVMVYQGKEDGIFERLIHLEQGKYFFAESEAGGVRVAFDSIADAIARIPNAQKIAQEVVEKLLRQTE